MTVFLGAGRVVLQHSGPTVGGYLSPVDSGVEGNAIVQPRFDEGVEHICSWL